MPAAVQKVEAVPATAQEVVLSGSGGAIELKLHLITRVRLLFQVFGSALWKTCYDTGSLKTQREEQSSHASQKRV